MAEAWSHKALPSVCAMQTALESLCSLLQQLQICTLQQPTQVRCRYECVTTTYHCADADCMLLLWCVHAAVQVRCWFPLVCTRGMTRLATSSARGAASGSTAARESCIVTDQGTFASTATTRRVLQSSQHRSSIAPSVPTTLCSRRSSGSEGSSYTPPSQKHRSRSAAL